MRIKEEEMNISQPLFSIVIPVYNASKYLGFMMDSILKQSFTDYEIVLVNDGSTDDSGALCDSYIEKYKNIQVIHKENYGAVQARCDGLRASRGSYILNVDADDALAEEALAKLYSIIENENPDVIFSDYATMDCDGNITKQVKKIKTNDRVLNKNEILYQFLTSSSLNALWIKCIRRDIIADNLDLSEFGRLNMADDELISIKIFENAQKFIYSGECLYYYRINPLGITGSRYNPQHAFDSMRVKEEKYNLIKRMNLSDKYLTSFYQQCTRTMNNYCIKATIANKTKKEYARFSQNLFDRYHELYKPEMVTKVIDKVICFLVRHNCFYIERFIGKVYMHRKTMMSA